uniref:Uncharacterized protein n=1 Tax=Seriola lalandi dorsalis TaxID=1841481 RepID=A0A3B4YPU5_SERLL
QTPSPACADILYRISDHRKSWRCQTVVSLTLLLSESDNQRLPSLLFTLQLQIGKKCCLLLLCVFIFVCFTYLLPLFLCISLPSLFPPFSMLFDISLLSQIYRHTHSKNSHALPHLS